MKKIIFICNNWLKDLGGGRKVVSLLLNNFTLKQNHFEFGLIDLEIGEKRENFSKIDSRLNEKIKFIPIFQPRVLKNIFPLSNILRKEKPNIIVDISGPNVKAISFFIARFSIPKVKYLLVEHSPSQSLIHFLKHQLINKILIFFAYKYADKVISVSKELSEQTKKDFNLKDKQVDYIYNPFDLSNVVKKSREEISHQWFESKTKPIILSVARLDSLQKDFFTLFKAFALVLKQESARLVIVGEGPQKKELEKLSKKLDISENVWFVGFQENPYKFIAKANIFVLSTKFEALPTVLIEAMACGVPVISSDCDFGPREILENGKNGILVPVGDVEKMAKVILELLKNQELCKQFREKGKRKVSEFTIEKSVRQYEKIFNEVLKI